MTIEKKMNPLRYINRVDDDKKRRHSWKVSFRRQNQRVHKYFTDSVYGSKEAALSAALAYRAEYCASFAVADYTVWRCNLQGSNNTSGIVGVGRYSSVAKSGNKLPYWRACWHDADGRRKYRDFYVNTHGEENAKQLAARAREQGMEEVRRVLASRKARLEKDLLLTQFDEFLRAKMASSVHEAAAQNMLKRLLEAIKRDQINETLLSEAEQFVSK